jgi:hypothetical protein
VVVLSINDFCNTFCCCAIILAVSLFVDHSPGVHSHDVLWHAPPL